MDMLSNIIKKTDFLGRRHSPTFKTQTSVHTCLGGLLSIVFCILVSVGVFFLGRELYERKTPLSNMSESREEINDVKLEDIQPIFSLFDDKGTVLSKDKHLYDSFKISVFLLSPEMTQDGSFKLTKVQIPLTSCSAALLTPDNYHLFASTEIVLESYLCMDISKATYLSGEKPKTPLFIRNSSSSITSSTLALEIRQIKPNKGFEAFNLHLITKTGFLDITKYESPINYATKEIHQKIVADEEKELSIRFKINELKTDTGYVFSTEKTDQYFSLDSTVRESNKYSETDKRLIRVVFDVSMMRSIMSRKYLKLQQLIASTGGFIKAMTIILGFALRVHSEVALFNSINREKYRIEGKTHFKVKTEINNFVNEKTISPVLNKSSAISSYVGFCRYLKALLPFSKDYALQSEIERTFAYFDVLTTIKLASKVETLEQNYKELIKKNK